MTKTLYELGISMISLVSKDKKPAVEEAEFMITKTVHEKKEPYRTQEQIQKLDQLYLSLTQDDEH
ncbi:MAG: hypothetical protein LBG52_01705 [Candidatus Peribacteria bacterium]|jgi:hypothetical protein|nr:hypothetical protein [Candidatus Peribacteria bacterium]